MREPLFDPETGKVRDRDALRSISIGGRPGIYKRTDESTHAAFAERVEGRDESGTEVRQLNITPRTVEFGLEGKIT